MDVEEAAVGHEDDAASLARGGGSGHFSPHHPRFGTAARKGRLYGKRVVTSGTLSVESLSFYRQEDQQGPGGAEDGSQTDCDDGSIPQGQVRLCADRGG